jgi:Carbohydrate-selective porin, OprB family
MSSRLVTSAPSFLAKFVLGLQFFGLALAFCCIPAHAQQPPPAQPAPAMPTCSCYPHDEDVIEMPGDVEEDVNTSFGQPGAIFPRFQLPGRAAYEQFKLDTYEKIGLRFGVNYQQLWQYSTATLPGATYNTALGGWAAVEAIWTPVDRGGDYEGSLVLRLGWRGPLGDNTAPASFGVPQLGSLWSNYEFTDWGGGMKVEDLFWEQWLTRRLRLRVGNQIPTAVYNFSRFKDARVSFSASPFAFQETIPYPTFGLGMSARWLPIEGSQLYVDATLNDMNGDPNAEGLNWSTFGKGQYFYGAEVGYRWRRANGEFDHLHLDLFYASKRSTRMPNVLPNEAGGGFRVYGEKQFGNIVALGGYTYNTAEGGGITGTYAQQVLTGGVAFLNPVNVRGEIGLGGMWSQPIKNVFPGSGQRDQTGIETYWRILLTPNMTVTPGIQFIFNPSFNPTVDNMVVPSIKFRVVF